MMELNLMTGPLLPVDVQMRADAELGAAWRRCEAALPEGWNLRVTRYGPQSWKAEAYQTARTMGEVVPTERQGGDSQLQALLNLTVDLEVRPRERGR